MVLRRQMLVNTIGACVYLGVQWVMTIIIARTLGYFAAGTLGIAVSVSNVFMVIAQFSMRQFQVSDIEQKYSSYAYVKSRYATCLCAMFFCFLFCLINQYDQQKIFCIMAFMLIKVSEALSDVYQGIEQKYLKYDYICFSHIIRGGLFFLTLVIGCIYQKKLEVILSIIAVELILFVLLFERNYSKKIDKLFYQGAKSVSELIRECFPLVIYSFCITYIPVFPRLIYEKMFGEQNLGYFMSISSPTMIINAVISLLLTPLIPIVSELCRDKKIKQIENILFKLLATFGFLILISVYASKYVGGFVLELLFGYEIVPYVYTLAPIMISTIVISIIWTFGSILIIIRKIDILVKCSIGAVIMELVLASKMIEIFDMNGISYSIIISMGVLSICFFVIVVKFLKGLEKDGRLE